METPHAFLGIHVLGEMYGIETERLNDLKGLEAAMKKGIERSGATLCSLQSKQFDPAGVTLLALLSESHASIHTYPEEGALFYDAFTCGEECQPERICDALEDFLQPTHQDRKVIRRGGPSVAAVSTERMPAFAEEHA